LIAPVREGSRTLVKICGLSTAEAALAAAECGADLIGLVFAESRRRVTAEQASAIAERLAAHPDVVLTGVFVDPGMADLERIVPEARLEAVQLHGEEPPEFLLDIKRRMPGVKIIKAFSADGEPSHLRETGHGSASRGAAAERLLPYAGIADAFLVDSARGGTGKRFAWEIIPDYMAAAAAAGVPLFVAGGLDPGNVADLVGRYGPDGVDVSSGVETDGIKDVAKIAAFIERVRTIDQQRA
jgi:phosphoribosylanthranilate isomerase